MGEALAEVDQIVETFEALLRITQIEAGARRAHFSDVDLAAVLADVSDIYEPVAEEEGDRLDPPSMPGSPSSCTATANS